MSTSPAATAAGTSATAAALGLRPGLVDYEGAAHELLAVAVADGCLGLFVVLNLSESESASFPREPITYQRHAVHGDSGLREPILEIRLSRLIGKVSHVQFHVSCYLLLPKQRGNRH